MSLSFIDIADHKNGGSATSLTFGVGVAAAFDLLLIVLGFEAVAPGSGPWVAPNSTPGHLSSTGNGWKQLLAQDPEAAGCGLEVWAAVYGSGSVAIADFNASYAVQGLMAIYRGEYYDSSAGVAEIFTGAIRGSESAQVSGDDPAAPPVHSFVDELVIAVGADTLAGGWGTPTPTGWSSRADYARGGAGTVEITLADKPTTVEGDTGAIPWSAAASPSGARGATATLAVRPLPAAPAATSPLIAVEYAVAN